MLQVREVREKSGEKTGLEIREKSGNPLSSQGKVREFRHQQCYRSAHKATKQPTVCVVGNLSMTMTLTRQLTMIWTRRCDMMSSYLILPTEACVVHARSFRIWVTAIYITT
ncbi:hypothetical protein J6590_047422 [Homalodisca vitripennis]|nr:hypothetical protein J6590_047422 [Homalodisca vitripennis]